jgi:hypothetical protein
VAKQIMKEVDKNGDGVISFEEFKDMMNKDSDPQAQEFAAKRQRKDSSPPTPVKSPSIKGIIKTPSKQRIKSSTLNNKVSQIKLGGS